MKTHVKAVVLWAEDSSDDVLLLDRTLKKVQAEALWIRVRSAYEAIDYLEGRGVYSDRRKHPMPDAIVTDMNMPGLRGTDFIRLVRTIPTFDHIPAFVLTDCCDQRDVDVAVDAGAVGFYPKPRNGDWEKRICAVLDGISNVLRVLRSKTHA